MIAQVKFLLLFAAFMIASAITHDITVKELETTYSCAGQNTLLLENLGKIVKVDESITFWPNATGAVNVMIPVRPNLETKPKFNGTVIVDFNPEEVPMEGPNQLPIRTVQVRMPEGSTKQVRSCESVLDDLRVIGHDCKAADINEVVECQSATQCTDKYNVTCELKEDNIWNVPYNDDIGYVVTNITMIKARADQPCHWRVEFGPGYCLLLKNSLPFNYTVTIRDVIHQQTNKSEGSQSNQTAPVDSSIPACLHQWPFLALLGVLALFTLILVILIIVACCKCCKRRAAEKATNKNLPDIVIEKKAEKKDHRFSLKNSRYTANVPRRPGTLDQDTDEQTLSGEQHERPAQNYGDGSDEDAELDDEDQYEDVPNVSVSPKRSRMEGTESERERLANENKEADYLNSPEVHIPSSLNSYDRVPDGDSKKGASKEPTLKTVKAPDDDIYDVV